MIAGSDTTSNLLAALLLYVFEQPRIVEKLRKEINSVVKSDSDITVENFKKLHYLECVISEISRVLNPTGGLFDRRTIIDTTFGGIPVSKGTILSAIWTNFLYNPDIF